uniref:Uncharacterized protein n=1 Tax=Kalanchoe fedtschenkoi TaxID=63787 RepID=A0A7N0TFM2_KALFE
MFSQIKCIPSILLSSAVTNPLHAVHKPYPAVHQCGRAYQTHPASLHPKAPCYMIHFEHSHHIENPNSRANILFHLFISSIFLI